MGIKYEARFGPTKNIGKWPCVVVGKALVQILSRTINAFSGFMEGVVVYLVNCRMWLVSDVRGVLLAAVSRRLLP